MAALPRLKPPPKPPPAPAVEPAAGSESGAESVALPVVRFNVKSRVSGNWQGAGQWFPGSVVTVNGDGTYAIQYDDGDFDESVPDGHLVAM